MNQNQNDIYYCYSLRLYHFLVSFREKCYSTNHNKNTGKRYWTFKKSQRVDSLIALYNELKHKY